MDRIDHRHLLFLRQATASQSVPTSDLGCSATRREEKMKLCCVQTSIATYLESFFLGEYTYLEVSTTVLGGRENVVRLFSYHHVGESGACKLKHFFIKCEATNIHSYRWT